MDCNTHETARVRPETLWRFYRDVASWPAWDRDVESATLNGPFANGSTGRLKPAGGPGIAFTLANVVPDRSFVDDSTLPLARLRFAHTVDPVDDGVRFTHSERTERADLGG